MSSYEDEDDPTPYDDASYPHELCYCSPNPDPGESPCSICRPPIDHDRRCRTSNDENEDWYGKMAMCRNCHGTNFRANLCTCVRALTSRIRTHSGKILVFTDDIGHEMYHNMPEDFPQCRDNGLCPMDPYRKCDAYHPSDTCMLLTSSHAIVCHRCVAWTGCRIEGCHGLVLKSDTTELSPDHICYRHYKYQCGTCARVEICTFRTTRPPRRKQCPQCDVMSASIICVRCGVKHKPHTLAYPYAQPIAQECMPCYTGNFQTYWQLIQNNVIWQLYTTIAASPHRKTISFATLLMLHLTWHTGHMDTFIQAGERACMVYALSQRTCAASALVRTRWLPQPLRLMILGYMDVC